MVSPDTGESNTVRMEDGMNSAWERALSALAGACIAATGATSFVWSIEMGASPWRLLMVLPGVLVFAAGGLIAIFSALDWWPFDDEEES